MGHPKSRKNFLVWNKKHHNLCSISKLYHFMYLFIVLLREDCLGFCLSRKITTTKCPRCLNKIYCKKKKDRRRALISSRVIVGKKRILYNTKRQNVRLRAQVWLMLWLSFSVGLKIFLLDAFHVCMSNVVRNSNYFHMYWMLRVTEPFLSFSSEIFCYRFRCVHSCCFRNKSVSCSLKDLFLYKIIANKEWEFPYCVSS